jgi:nitrite reductase/ring-hydroxylating ferredoxin subunit
MPFVKVSTLAQLPGDSVREVSVNGEFYALCRVGDRVTALSGTCLHRGGPLGHGNIQGNRVVCPWHAWEFDCATGEYDYDPTRRVATFPVKIEGEDILIEVP